MDNYGGNLDWQDWADEEFAEWMLAKEASDRREAVDEIDFGLPIDSKDDIPF